MDHLMSPPWFVRGMQILAAALLAACGGGDAGTPALVPNGANVAQAAQAQSCDFSQALVMVDGIRIRQVDANDIVVTLPERRPVDLLDPGTGVLEAMQIAPLTRDAIDVRLRASDGTVRLPDGTIAPLKVPGNLRLTGDFRLAAGMVADLVVQGFDRCAAIHAAGNSGQFVLNGDVPAQLRALPFVTDREQAVGGFLRPIPGDGYATVSNRMAGSLAIQRFDAYGQMRSGAISISLPGDASSANVIPLAKGGALATWLGPATDPDVPLAQHFPLMVQRFVADGSAQGPPVQVALAQPFTSPDTPRGPIPPNLPQAAALEDGGVALVWVQVDANGHLNLYLERFAADGSAAFGPQLVNVAGDGNLPNVVGLTGGRVLVAWGRGQLFARVFEANGSAGAEQVIAPLAASVFGPPQLAALSNGGAAVAWELQVARFPIITRLVLAPDGAPLGSQQLFADGVTPSIAGLADGGFVIAWFTQSSVNAQRFGPDGSPRGPATNLTSTAAAGTSVVALPWGGFLIGWPTVTDGNPQDVMRFFDTQGLLGT